MSWEIRIPNRGPDQPLLDTIDDLRHALPDKEERATVRRLLIEELVSGTETVGAAPHIPLDSRQRAPVGIRL